MKRHQAVQGIPDRGNATAADRRDIWREILSAEGNGSVPGDANLEPFLDWIDGRAATR